MTTTAATALDNFIETQGANPEVQEELLAKLEIAKGSNLATKSAMLDIVVKRWILTKAALETAIIHFNLPSMLNDEYEKRVTPEIKKAAEEAAMPRFKSLSKE